MDIRTMGSPIVRASGRWLRRVNDRHPWSHNDHFHGWVLRRFEDVDGTFDAVTMIAVLHHLPLEPALRHVAELLAPGGRLLVVGLARADSLADLAWDLPSSLLNPLVGLVKHPQPVRTPVDDGGGGACGGGADTEPVMPVRDPAETFAEISRTARTVLPGARVHRRLFFRYTLEWTRPR